MKTPGTDSPQASPLKVRLRIKTWENRSSQHNEPLIHPPYLADIEALFAAGSLGLHGLATSVVTAREILGAPPEVQEQFSSTFTDTAQILELTVEAESLAQAYLAAGVVTPKYADDARHVAIATVHGHLVIVSWNFHHLVNLRREAAFNAVNLLQGYPSVRIVSPLEVIHESEEDEAV